MFCHKVRYIVETTYVFDTINPVRWFWQLFPDVPFEIWFESLFSPAEATIIFLSGYSLCLRSKGFQLRADVIAARRDAQKKKIGETCEGRGNTTDVNNQSTGSIHASGHVSIHQEMNNDLRIKNSEKDFPRLFLD